MYRDFDLVPMSMDLPEIPDGWQINQRWRQRRRNMIKYRRYEVVGYAGCPWCGGLPPDIMRELGVELVKG